MSPGKAEPPDLPRLNGETSPRLCFGIDRGLFLRRLQEIKDSNLREPSNLRWRQTRVPVVL